MKCFEGEGSSDVGETQTAECAVGPLRGTRDSALGPQADRRVCALIGSVLE